LDLKISQLTFFLAKLTSQQLSSIESCAQVQGRTSQSKDSAYMARLIETMVDNARSLNTGTLPVCI